MVLSSRAAPAAHLHRRLLLDGQNISDPREEKLKLES